MVLNWPYEIKKGGIMGPKKTPRASKQDLGFKVYSSTKNIGQIKGGEGIKKK